MQLINKGVYPFQSSSFIPPKSTPMGIKCKSSNRSQPSDWSTKLFYGVRACLKIAKGASAGNFGFGQGGEGGASPQRAVTTEPTLDKDKKPAARRVFAEKAVWLRYSSVEDPPRVFSFVASRQSAFSQKTAPFGILRQALRSRLRVHAKPCLPPSNPDFTRFSAAGDKPHRIRARRDAA